ncbi:MAG: hypothetical protein ABIA93_04525 [Candidatus Woesearchaeota archaeon]
MCMKADCPYKEMQYGKPKQVPKEEFAGATPNVFVGKYGYPNVHVGFLGNEGVTEENDAPLLWKKEAYSIPRIVNLRSALVNARFVAPVKGVSSKMTELAQEASMSIKPVDYEVTLTKKPIAKLSLDQSAIPYGPSVQLKKTRFTANVKIPHFVDKAVSDIDLKASAGLGMLTKKGMDEHYLVKVLSLGNLGVKVQRRIVPTRWSITAVDDTLGKQKIKEIKNYPQHDFALGEGEYLGNTFFVLFFPQEWSYELIESYKPRDGPLHSNMTTDYESFEGRKDYVHETAGGYYAARLSILEELSRKKRQAGVLALRIVNDEYFIPLGVWVVREAVRNAMRNIVVVKDETELLALVEQRMGLHGVSAMNDYIVKSIMLKERKRQKRLGDY